MRVPGSPPPMGRRWVDWLIRVGFALELEPELEPELELELELKMEVFNRTIQVTRSDLDELQHVNNVRYVHWIQEIARDHWLSVAPPDLISSAVWVVRRHEIEYKAPALLGETLRLRTFIADTRGPLSTRVVEMFNHQDNSLVLSSKTTWCLLDAITLRPMRISDEISSLFIKNRV